MIFASQPITIMMRPIQEINVKATASVTVKEHVHQLVGVREPQGHRQLHHLPIKQPKNLQTLQI